MTFVQTYGADESYCTPQAGNVPVLENAVQVATKPRRLMSLYAYNTAASAVVLAVLDSPNGGTNTVRTEMYPIPAGSFVSIAVQGGTRFETGIYMFAATDKTLGASAGNVMFYKIGYTAYA